MSSDATAVTTARRRRRAGSAAAPTTASILPDGVRLVLTLPPGQAISGRLTRDWVEADLDRGQVMRSIAARDARTLPSRRPRPSAGAGAALLAAMLTVTLVATFAAAALWQQWRSIEVETAERARVQSAWVLTGALDWARLLLREDAKSGGADHLGEPWAVPLQEARLSSFLAADRANTAETGPEVFDAFLSGEIIDLQSRLNVTNLVDNGKVSEPDLRSFARLFEQLGLPQAQLDQLAENLRFASDASAGNRSSPHGAAAAAARRAAGVAGPARRAPWRRCSPSSPSCPSARP